MGDKLNYQLLYLPPCTKEVMGNFSFGNSGLLKSNTSYTVHPKYQRYHIPVLHLQLYTSMKAYNIFQKKNCNSGN